MNIELTRTRLATAAARLAAAQEKFERAIERAAAAAEKAAERAEKAAERGELAAEKVAAPKRGRKAKAAPAPVTDVSVANPFDAVDAETEFYQQNPIDPDKCDWEEVKDLDQPLPRETDDEEWNEIHGLTPFDAAVKAFESGASIEEIEAVLDAPAPELELVPNRPAPARTSEEINKIVSAVINLDRVKAVTELMTMYATNGAAYSREMFHEVQEVAKEARTALATEGLELAAISKLATADFDCIDDSQLNPEDWLALSLIEESEIIDSLRTKAVDDLETLFAIIEESE